MTAETTYLELSDDAGSSHKFYEVVVTGTNVNIRYGRIGEQGTSKASSGDDNLVEDRKSTRLNSSH